MSRNGQAWPAAASHERAALAELRGLALSGLPLMFDRGAGLFSFCVRRSAQGLSREGVSRRYTAITLLGLAGEATEAHREILHGCTLGDVLERLTQTAGPADSLGDLALIAWSARLAGRPVDSIWQQIERRRPAELTHPTVEVAWTLSAAAAEATGRTAALRDALASRLRAAISRHGLFPHSLPVRPAAETRQEKVPARSRSHVTCFADLVYPVLALAQHGEASGDRESIEAAVAGATAICRRQGADGQWWWHYDYRTGRVLEPYPVYAVHQDAMAPMALFAAAQAGRRNFDAAIGRGMRWLLASPELDGGTLIDRRAGIIWRKVARREPAKLSRYVQAGVSRLSPRLRAPGLDVIFPPRAIDYEDRAYHLGWVLYAWPEQRVARWAPERVQ